MVTSHYVLVGFVYEHGAPLTSGRLMMIARAHFSQLELKPSLKDPPVGQTSPEVGSSFAGNALAEQTSLRSAIYHCCNLARERTCCFIGRFCTESDKIRTTSAHYDE